MDPDKVKDKIKLAKKIVEGEKDELYKTEAFKIILSKLLESEKDVQKTDLSKNTETVTKQSPIDNIEEKQMGLANKCNVTINELEQVIFIKDNTIEIISPISGSDARKHVIVTQCLLAAYQIIFEQEWVSSQIIIKCLRSMGVKDVTNLSLTLKKYSDLVIGRGTRGHKEYRLTSGQGRISAFNTIHELAKGKEFEKEKSN